MKGASPLIRRQLIAFSVAAVIGAIVLGTTFLRVPEQLGIGRQTVSIDLAQAAGLYEGAEVTYLGHPVGKVVSLEVRDAGLRARLSIEDDADVPADVRAEVHSRSAVGEQYVSLVPPPGGGNGVLADGAVIPRNRTSTPVEIGPVLDNVKALTDSVDADRLSTLIREAGTSLQGRSGDLQAILDDGGDLLEAARRNIGPTERLLRDAEPVLQTINGQAPAVQRLLRNLDGVTGQLRAADGDLRSLLDDSPVFTRETVALLAGLQQTLPGLLQRANPVAGTLSLFNAHLEQLLSDLPRAVATVQSVTVPNLDTAEVRLTVANADEPPECTRGFLPAKQWTSVFGTAPEVTPLVYCAAPKSDPRGVRGARNLPCPGNPVRREAEFAKC